MARRTAVWPVLMTAPWPSPVLPDSCSPSGRGRDNRAARRTAPPAWRIGSGVELVIDDLAGAGPAYGPSRGSM